MEKAIGSRIPLDDLENQTAVEFHACIADLIRLPEVLSLSEYSQHLGTSRYQHSLNVSYYSFLMAKSLGCDYVSAARGGLLHDLFYYNFKATTLSCGRHAFWHPRIALENARKIVSLNKIEEDIIIKHMWPMTISLPKYKEAYIVSLADKYCAAFETAGAFKNMRRLFRLPQKIG